ncbi:MAG: hypothetical protein ABSC63_07420 [Candidatus Binataceae bacterium]|jgi:hypothetical protein
MDSAFLAMGSESGARVRIGRGGKVRSETVTVRLDPKLRYLADLAGRKQRRTLSSFIEWAIEEALKTVTIGEHYDDRGNNYTTSIGTAASELWDVDAPERFVKLAFRYPELLNHEEQLLWKLIRQHGFFWKGNRGEDGKWCFNPQSESSTSFRNLRECWDLVNKVARGEAPVSAIPSADVPVVVTSPPDRQPSDDDEDIPF